MYTSEDRENDSKRIHQIMENVHTDDLNTYNLNCLIFSGNKCTKNIIFKIINWFPTSRCTFISGWIDFLFLDPSNFA